MRIEESDDIYVNDNADLPVDIDESYLPDDISPEAAYIICEAALDKKLGDIAAELGTDNRSIGKTLRSAKEEGFIEYDENRRRGRDYDLTPLGRQLLRSYLSAEKQIGEGYDGEIKSSRTIFLGNSERYNSMSDLTTLIGHLHDEHGIEDVEQETGHGSQLVSEIRNTLEPLYETETVEYTITYEPSLLGVQLLSHPVIYDLLAFNLNGDNENINGDQDDEEELGWTEIRG